MDAHQHRQDPVADSEDQPAFRTPAGDAFSDLVTRVVRLAGLLSAATDGLAATAGQTGARWQVLAVVGESPRTVADAARTLGLARQSVQRIADLLAAAGLVAYEENPQHRRARLLSLTLSGRSALDAIQAAQGPWADRLGTIVGEMSLRESNAILDRVLRALAPERTR